MQIKVYSDEDYQNLLDETSYPIWNLIGAQIEINGPDTVLYTADTLTYRAKFLDNSLQNAYEGFAKYHWTLPRGWRIDGNDKSSEIKVIPDSIHGGKIECYAYLDTSYYNYSQYSESDKAQKSITRDFGTINISGPTSVILGDTDLKTYSVQGVSFYDYTWTVGSDMTITSVNRNSSNVSFHCNGGQVRCTIRHKYVNDQTQVSKTVSITKPRPAIIGDNVVCSNKTFQLSSTPRNLTHTNWLASSNVSINSSTNTSASIHINQSGDSWIKANIRILDCPSYDLDQRYFWAGAPLRPDAQPAYATIYQSQLLTLRVSTPPKGYPDTYYWNVTGAIQIVTSPTGSQTTVEGQSVGYGYYTVTAHNKCGNSPVVHGTVKVERNVIIHPNPTPKDVYVEIKPSEKLKSSKFDPGDEVHVEIYDINSGTLLQKMTFYSNEFKVPMSSYPAGIYLLKVKKDGHEYSTKVIKQ